MKIIWTSTGDEISIVPTHRHLCEYFVYELAQRPLVCVQSDIDEDCHNNLLLFLNDINSFLEHTGIAEPFAVGDPYDQKYLNELHRSWVKFHLAHPTIVNLLRHKDPALVLKFRGINKTLHKIEKMFMQTWLGTEEQEVIAFDNPFAHLLTFSASNVQIMYNDLGRNTYNKWVNFDSDLDQQDTNDYKKLAAELHVNLNRPKLQAPPANYVKWCEQQGLPTAPGQFMSLGNFVDLEQRLADYRKIIVRNSNNSMTLTF